MVSRGRGRTTNISDQFQCHPYPLLRFKIKKTSTGNYCFVTSQQSSIYDHQNTKNLEDHDVKTEKKQHLCKLCGVGFGSRKERRHHFKGHHHEDHQHRGACKWKLEEIYTKTSVIPSTKAEGITRVASTSITSEENSRLQPAFDLSFKWLATGKRGRKSRIYKPPMNPASCLKISETSNMPKETLNAETVDGNFSSKKKPKSDQENHENILKESLFDNVEIQSDEEKCIPEVGALDLIQVKPYVKQAHSVHADDCTDWGSILSLGFTMKEQNTEEIVPMGSNDVINKKHLNQDWGRLLSLGVIGKKYQKVHNNGTTSRTKGQKRVVCVDGNHRQHQLMIAT